MSDNAYMYGGLTGYPRLTDGFNGDSDQGTPSYPLTQPQSQYQLPNYLSSIVNSGVNIPGVTSSSSTPWPSTTGEVGIKPARSPNMVGSTSTAVTTRTTGSPYPSGAPSSKPRNRASLGVPSTPAAINLNPGDVPNTPLSNDELRFGRYTSRDTIRDPSTGELHTIVTFPRTKWGEVQGNYGPAEQRGPRINLRQVWTDQDQKTMPQDALAAYANKHNQQLDAYTADQNAREYVTNRRGSRPASGPQQANWDNYYNQAYLGGHVPESGVHMASTMPQHIAQDKTEITQTAPRNNALSTGLESIPLTAPFGMALDTDPTHWYAQSLQQTPGTVLNEMALKPGLTFGGLALQGLAAPGTPRDVSTLRNIRLFNGDKFYDPEKSVDDMFSGVTSLAKPKIWHDDPVESTFSTIALLASLAEPGAAAASRTGLTRDASATGATDALSDRFDQSSTVGGSTYSESPSPKSSTNGNTRQAGTVNFSQLTSPEKAKAASKRPWFRRSNLDDTTTQPSTVGRSTKTESPPPTSVTKSNTGSSVAPAKARATDIYAVDDPFNYIASGRAQPEFNPFVPAKRWTGSTAPTAIDRSSLPPWRSIFDNVDFGDKQEHEASDNHGILDESLSDPNEQDAYADGEKGSAWNNRRDTREKPVGGQRVRSPRVLGSQDKQSIRKSVSFVQGPGEKSTQHALNAIDAVHNTGPLPKVEITGRSSLGGSHGLYYPHPSTPKIDFVHNGPWPIITNIHEIGHLLDEHGWWHPVGREASSIASQEFAGLRKALEKTEAVKSLRDLRGKTYILEPDGLGGVVRRKIEKSVVDYYLQPEELFARSYAQYIATKAAELGHPEVGAQLDEMLKHFETHTYQAQWQPKDFEPVRNAIEDLLKGE